MPAIRRTITRNHAQQVAQRPAPANAPVAPQPQRDAQAAPQEEAVEALPSLEDTLDRIDDKAEELEELAMASLRFDEGTSISKRVHVACTWRGVDPEEPYLFVQKYSLAEGDEVSAFSCLFASYLRAHKYTFQRAFAVQCVHGRIQDAFRRSV